MLTTQLSLIHRLRNAEDHEAWFAFVELYYPVIVRSLICKGLNTSDAEDTAQTVLLSVAKSLAKRPHDPDRARFRTWLERVIRNAVLNALQRIPPDRAVGGDEHGRNLQEVAGSEDESLLAFEFQKQLFHQAAQSIEAEFEPGTWQAFWRTAVLGEPIERVADALENKSAPFTRPAAESFDA